MASNPSGIRHASTGLLLSDELPYVIDDFGQKPGVDVSKINIARYCPVIKIPLLKRLTKGREVMKKIISERPLFTLRMFAESARAGRW